MTHETHKDTPAPRALAAQDRLDWLRLIRSENVGPITFYKLLERFGSAGRALAALPGLAARGGRSGRIKICPIAEAEREMETLADVGGVFIARGEAEYPPLLAHIEDAPPLITVKGHVHLLAKKAVAVVGARNASVNGQRLAREMAMELGAAGLLVVSGMARGIDARAHDGAVATGTAAILGGGVDVIYPKENAALYQSICEQGVLISEAAPGTEPKARNFPRRNRLISGISRGVVVVEASPKSGTLITARMALEQGREVFAVPGSPLDPRARGTNGLIRQGAVLTESAADVIQNLNQLPATLDAGNDLFDFKGNSTNDLDETELEKARGRVLESLSPAPVTVDELIRNCQVSPAVVFMALLELELAGRLERHPGNRVSLIGPVSLIGK